MGLLKFVSRETSDGLLSNIFHVLYVSRETKAKSKSFRENYVSRETNIMKTVQVFRFIINITA